MGTWVFIGVVVLVVGALLALDWFMAGRAGGRRGRSAADSEAGNLNVGYGLIEQRGNAMKDKSV